MHRLPIRDNLDRVSNVTEESDLHFAKQFAPKNSTDEGRMIPCKPVLLNTPLSIPDNFEPDSNVTEESDPHKEKHSSPKSSTDAGRMISTKTVSWNSCFSICDNFEPDSNRTEESDAQPEKHPEPKTSTDAGELEMGMFQSIGKSQRAPPLAQCGLFSPQSNIDFHIDVCRRPSNNFKFDLEKN
jgi:hypothetical protein